MAMEFGSRSADDSLGEIKPTRSVDTTPKRMKSTRKVTIESNNNNDEFPTPTIQVATTENGEKIPFNARITIDQASKMLRSDILWVNYQISSTKSAPPTNLRNAFEVLKAAQTTKRSLPVKYPNPINGSFKLFNRLVSLCEESGVFFR